MSLTRRGVLLGIFCGLLAIAGLWRSPWLVAMAAAAFGMWCAALLLEYRDTRGLEVSFALDLPDTLRLGVPARFSSTVNNAASRPLVIEWLQQLPIALSGPPQKIERRTIAAQDELQHSISVLPCELGEGSVLAPAFRLSGRYGLALWNRTPDAVPRTFTVHPDTLLSYSLGLSGSQMGEQRHRKMGQGAEIEELRSYRRGDPLRLIDWKASAKRNAHIVRETSEDQHLEIMIAVDAGRSSNLLSGNLSLLGHYVNVAARLAEYATLQGDRVGLLIFAERTLHRVPPGRGAAALSRIRRDLGAVRSQAIDANPLGAALDISRMLKQRSLVVLLSDFEHADSTGQQVRATQLLARRHQTLLASVRNDDIDALASSDSGHWLTPHIALAAQDAQAARAATGRQLRALNATLVQARGQDLDHQVLATYRRLRSDRRI